MSPPGERRPPGPRPAHSVAAVAAAAVALADAEGLPAVTMRRIGARLGVSAMSVYGYVPDKTALVGLMVDAVAAEHDLAALPDDGRAALTAVFGRQRELVHAHPWLPEALARGPALGPHGLAVLERVLAAMDDAGFPPESQLEAFGVLTGFVMNFASSERARTATHPSAPLAPPPEAYPRLAARLTGPAWIPDAGFSRILARLLTAFATN